MNTFGKAHIVPLSMPGKDQFQIYNHISRHHDYSFLFESLTGPEILTETSIIGFSPAMIFRGYANRVEKTVVDEHAGDSGDIRKEYSHQSSHPRTETVTVHTDDPFGVLRATLAAAAAPDATGMCDDCTVHDTGYENSAVGNGGGGGTPYDYRYLGGAVGTVNYDAIRTIEDIPDSNRSDPLLMEFGIYDDGILYDHKLKRPFYFYHRTNRIDQIRPEESAGAESSEDAKDPVGSQSRGGADPPCGGFRAYNFTPNMDKAQFCDMVSRAKKYIHDGDIFQVVLARRVGFDTSGDTLELYRTLRALNPSPYMYHLRHGSSVTIGASPEMLVRVTGDTVETFPIAGTRGVTGDRAADARLAEEMVADQKEVAEHTMLVDLGRNDIGRVCRFGTVRPKSLMEIKKFSHVQHMVTHLAGSLDDDKDMFDAFRAVFPAGTVSGAPKIRAMEIIDSLEPDARGPYAGAVGYFSYNGCCDFAIAIRSIYINGSRGFVQAGAGIVYDSVPELEFKETEHKAGAALQALSEASA